ncbi:MAG: DUF2284 domain-containing protein, partial [Proteobacteria bacterium]|nr:DUF2284 domain-containing protein [Pseudomonadota bacterium]
MYDRIAGSYQLIYETLKGRKYPLELGYGAIPSSFVPIDKKTTVAACKYGCGLYGRNGGCPPFAPNFNEIPGNELLILYARLETKHYPHRVLSGPYYTKWVLIETLLTPLTNRIGRRIAGLLDGYFLSSGNCQVCRPKRCAVKEGKRCRNPEGRSYSLEATGVLVTELMKRFLGIELDWWRKGEPAYIP